MHSSSQLETQYKLTKSFSYYNSNGFPCLCQTEQSVWIRISMNYSGNILELLSFKKIRERQEPLSNIYFGKNVSYGQSTDEARTAKLLRTEMSTLRDDKMRPLFQEAIVTNLVVTHSTTRYQMKARDIIFPMIPIESLWVKWFRHHSPAKLGIFPK